MTSPVTHDDVYTDFQGLSELRSRARNNSEETLREVAGQFEALFIQMMLKSMRDAGFGEGLLDSEHTKTYQAMFDKQISIDLSKRQGLGLAEMMVRQLSRAGGDSGSARPEPAPQSPAFQTLVRPTPAVGVSARSLDAHSVSAVNTAWRPESPQAFVTELWPHAERAAHKLGVAPEALIAQAALETGWGKHVMTRPDGHSSFNLFGIKADARWRGERVTSETIEFRDGLMRKERANFRAYSSLAEGLADYTDFLQSNPRYRDALNKAGDGAGFAQALAEAGYATDPEYFSKIKQIIGSEQLRRAVSEIKESASEPLS
jgi:flagellar protein FlgJ